MHEHDQQTPNQLCIWQTKAHTWLSLSLLPCNGNCSYCTMGNAPKQSAKASPSYRPSVAPSRAIDTVGCTFLRLIEHRKIIIPTQHKETCLFSKKPIELNFDNMLWLSLSFFNSDVDRKIPPGESGAVRKLIIHIDGEN